jgi:hypothetical protein
MKKLTLMLFTVVLMLSCGNSGTTSQTKDGDNTAEADSQAVGSSAEATPDKHSEAYIRQRIDTIYETVGKTVIDSDGREVEYIHNPFNRDSAYCSERYYALIQKARLLCNQMGDIMYDYDHWICGQDFSDDWSCEVTKVYEMTDSSALVNLVVHNFTETETTIALRFERNDWYIDDFSPSKDGNDDKKFLRDIIRRGLRTREKTD